MQNAPTPPPACALCGRSHPDLPLTRHHWVPRAYARRRKRGRLWKTQQADLAARAHETADLCPDCHRTVHATLSERELALAYHTLELLRAHPEIARFAAWAAKQDPARRVRVRKPAARR